MNIHYNYSDEKDTLPKSAAVSDVEADFDALGGRLIVLSTTLSGSEAPAPTSYFTEGDYIVCLDQNYVGWIRRIVDDYVIEVTYDHGLTATGVACRKIENAQQFRDYSFLVGSDAAALIKGKFGDEVTFPAESSDGGNGFEENNYFPIIIDAATNRTTVIVKAVV